ncbi:MAG: EAL domain-containing protein (putative c-di-GMP-specific phosphodiesterase class I) [Sulfurimonas sp.]|jgi:EAL domain-containing protein (putative c-di-GMP-specific phosphodiesterase class I)/GGDEF domain-containing protein|uniref:EAL domain-containing protein n=1 Tax=Sulfurimonas sp. TaxID=2022749 RepID=UPI0039E43200
MLLPQTKEREYRFKLALRMGLPIFFLFLAFISNRLFTSYENIDTSFYFISIILLAFSIYFIFFLIYSGFDVKITESVSKTFSREYLYTYINKEIDKNEPYSLVLLSVDNLDAINTKYGIGNGDKVIFEVAQYLGNYLKGKNITNFPMGHIKGGDFVIGLQGKKENFNTIIELLCLKSNEFKVDEIEVSISGAITDTLYSRDLDYMIENLFELQSENRHKKSMRNKNEMDPNDLESFVIGAIDAKSVSIMSQCVYENDNQVIEECFVKLKNTEGKILHPKSYMKVIHKLGLTAEYDYLVLEKILLHCMQRSDNILSITVSPTSLRNHNFLEKTKNLLQENIHLKNRLIFMTSEVEYYSHIERYNTTLQSLRREGVKIGIDRLGSLHTSFLYLRDLDIDIVRYDSFYIKDIKNKKHKNMLEGFNTIAHSSNVKTWLKLVENKEIQEFAKEIKVDYIQGKALSELEKIYED